MNYTIPAVFIHLRGFIGNQLIALRMLWTRDLGSFRGDEMPNLGRLKGKTKDSIFEFTIRQGESSVLALVFS